MFFFFNVNIIIATLKLNIAAISVDYCSWTDNESLWQTRYVCFVQSGSTHFWLINQCPFYTAFYMYFDCTWIYIIHSYCLTFSVSWYQVSFKNTLKTTMHTLCVSVFHIEINWMHKSTWLTPVEPWKMSWLGFYQIGSEINQLYFKVLYKRSRNG